VSVQIRVDRRVMDDGEGERRRLTAVIVKHVCLRRVDPVIEHVMERGP